MKKKIFIGIVPIICFVLMELILKTSLYKSFLREEFTLISWLIVVFINLLLYYFVYIFFILNIKNTYLAINLYLSLFFLLSLLNAFIAQARGYALVSTDLFCFRTAININEGFHFYLTQEIILTIISYILLFFINRLLIKNTIYFLQLKTRLKLIIQSFLIIGMSFFILTFFKVENLEKVNVPNCYSQLLSIDTRGWFYSFVSNINGFFNKKPENYVEKKYYDLDNDTSENPKTPNIIMIVNESYSDMTIFNEDYKKLYEYTNSLNESIIKGEMYVSIYGGYTANTEFELLTSSSIANFDSFCIPFLQKINQPIYSYPTFLKEYNYDSIAIHSYLSSGYNRYYVYPFLGFDKCIFSDLEINSTNLRGIKVTDSPKIEYYDIIRKDFPSDDWNYQQIINEFKNKNNNPLFIYDLTVQNHNPYTDYENSENLAILNSDFSLEQTSLSYLTENEYKNQLNKYLTLLKSSDKQLKTLIDFFSDYEEDTIIIFCGDHQSFLTEPLSLGENGELVKVPFFIWSNFTLQDEASSLEQDIELSSNYLLPFVISKFNLPKNHYIDNLLQLQNKLPVYCYFGTKDNKGIMTNLNSSKFQTDIKEYKKQQYYLLFDYKNQN